MKTHIPAALSRSIAGGMQFHARDQPLAATESCTDAHFSILRASRERCKSLSLFIKSDNQRHRYFAFLALEWMRGMPIRDLVKARLQFKKHPMTKRS
jgi:hypothetical protein